MLISLIGALTTLALLLGARALCELLDDYITGIGVQPKDAQEAASRAAV